MPDLSVIHLTFNKLERLRIILDRFKFNAIRSPTINFEIVILNGGSTDGTTQYLNDLIKEEKLLKIKHIFIQYPGWCNPSQLRNIATKYCDGDIVCYTDGDHFPSEDFIYYAIKPFANNNDKIVNRAMVWDSSESKKLPANKINEAILSGKLNQTKILDLYQSFGIPIRHNIDKQFWCYALRKEAIYEIGGHDESFMGAWSRDEEYPQIALQHLGYKFIYDYDKQFSMIHLWHPYGGPDGRRDSKRNHQIFLKIKENLSQIIKQNKQREWGVISPDMDYYVERNF